MKKFLSISLSLTSSVVMFSQPNPTDAESIINAYKDKEILVQSSRVKNIELKSENSDYDAKRYNDFTLERPEIIISKKGVFLKWLELNNKMGGQNKIPRLSNERKFIESLIRLNN